MATRDQGYYILTTGQSNWDTDLDTNFQTLEGGYRVTEQAGVAITTGQVLYLSSGAFFVPFNPNTPAIVPHALALSAANSGDSLQALAWGIVRSLGINSASVPGEPLFVSAMTPGLVSATSFGPCIGAGLKNYGVLFNPPKPFTGGGGGGGYTPSFFTSSVAINAVVGSLHTFTASIGMAGWNRRVRINGSSADHCEVKWYGDAGRSTELQYATFSGGVNVISGNFNDRAGWPVNTDSGTLYGTLAVFSWDVTSDTIAVICDWEF